MTKLKAALAASVITPLVITALGYTTQKPGAIETFYFKKVTNSSRKVINPGTQALSKSEITNTANWTTTTQLSAPGLYLSSIAFDQEPGDASDGIGDGQYSLQEAINALWNEYIRSSQFDLPGHDKSFTPDIPGATPITIGRAACNSDQC
jgi:hypothetical protein